MMTGSSRRNLLFSDESSIKGHKFGKLKQGSKDDIDARLSTVAPDHSPYEASLSPSSKSPWSSHMSNPAPSFSNHDDHNGTLCDVLIGSLTREEGHIYSLAANKDFLYTGSDSKNIRVWKNQQEFSGFKANSGLVKSIVIAGEKILTGHQDGRIRVWKVSAKNDHQHKRVATLPTLKNYIKCSMKPSNYVEVRRHRNVLWIKHYDAISCLALTPDLSYIYSASWDRTFKVWRGSDFKCLESVNAHDDAVNALVVGPDGLVYTGSADGTVKVWRREVQGKGTKHFFTKNLLKQECAVTALAMNQEASYSYLYCGSSDGLVNYWEQEKTAIEGGVLKGHKLAVLCLATAGSMVFSGSADMGICVWKRTSNDAHICMSVLTSHTGPVKCLAVERDHETSLNDRKWILYSGSLDKSVKVWRVSEHASGHVHSQHVQPPRRSCEVFSRVSSMRRTGSKMH